MEEEERRKKRRESFCFGQTIGYSSVVVANKYGAKKSI